MPSSVGGADHGVSEVPASGADALLAGAAESLQIVHQPIVAIDSMTPVGCEALSRFPGDSPEPPDVWFSDAHAIGVGVDLEREEDLATIVDLGVPLAQGYPLGRPAPPPSSS